MAINFLNTIAVDENVLFVDTTNDRVGIGTASPSEKLSISGAKNTSIIHLGSTTNNSSWSIGDQIGAIEFGSADNSGAGAGVKASISYEVEAGATGSTNSMVFRSAGTSASTNNTERMRITASGNVGIGTTSPGTKLYVDGGESTFNRGNSDGAIARFRGKNAEKAVIGTVDSWFASNVGIGTTSPGEKLDVNGNIKIKDTLLSNQENTDIDSAAAEVVAQVAHATYTAAFFDFVVKKGTNVRSGTVYACHNGDTTPLVEFTETSTNDLGDTSDVTLSVDISGANMRLVATVASDDWSVKTLVKAI